MTILTVLKIIGYILLAILGLNILFFFILWLISLTVKSEPPKKIYKIYQYAGKAFYTWAVLAARVRVHVSGEEKIPKDSRFLFVANHRSIFDPVVVGKNFSKYDIGFISKPSNTKLPIVWRLAHGIGYLAIDRENDREALKTIIQAVKYLKDDVCSIAIYPEGTRSKEEGMLPFHAGSFKIAQKAKVPIVLASTKNSDMVFKNLPWKRTHIYLDVIEVIPVEKVLEMSTGDLAEYSHKVIEEHLYG